MFITRKHLDRRTLLRGLGASVALPLLDAMIPARTALAKTAAAPKPRLGFVYFPHGAIMERWTPASAGRDFALSPILEPLAALKQQLTVVSNLGNKPGESRAVHALVPGTWLTCTHPTEGVNSHISVSADQLAAQYIGQDTPYPSLEIATAQGHGVGSACERGYGCSYSGTVSFRTPTTPLPVESNPRELFLRLFGQGDTPEERRFLAEQTRSILDMVAGEAAQLKRRIGAQDQAMLADYLDSIREIERRVQNADKGDRSKLDLPDTPGATPDSFHEHLTLLFDLLALAYQGDLTRVSTFMMAPEVSEQTYGHIGVPDAFHAVSHRGVRGFPGQAGTHARWRRQPARSFHLHVRQQHEQQQPAQPMAVAGAGGRWWCGQVAWRPAHPVCRAHPVGQPAAHRGAEGRRADRKVR